jgi:hypothetical protein
VTARASDLPGWELGPLVAAFVEAQGELWGEPWGTPSHGCRYPALNGHRCARKAIWWARACGRVRETVVDGRWVLRPGSGRSIWDERKA